MSANSTDATQVSPTTMFVASDSPYEDQLATLRDELSAGFLVHATPAIVPTSDELRHVRAHLRDSSVVLAEPTERHYLAFVRRGGRFGAPIPAVAERRLPFSALLSEDYELAILDEGNRRVVIYFSLRDRPTIRFGYAFVTPDRPDAKFAALYFKEDLESGRLRDRISAPGSSTSAVRWLSR